MEDFALCLIVSAIVYLVGKFLEDYCGFVPLLKRKRGRAKPPRALMERFISQPEHHPPNDPPNDEHEKPPTHAELFAEVLASTGVVPYGIVLSLASHSAAWNRLLCGLNTVNDVLSITPIGVRNGFYWLSEKVTHMTGSIYHLAEDTGDHLDFLLFDGINPDSARSTATHRQVESILRHIRCGTSYIITLPENITTSTYNLLHEIQQMTGMGNVHTVKVGTKTYSFFISTPARDMVTSTCPSDGEEVDGPPEDVCPNQPVDLKMSRREMIHLVRYIWSMPADGVIPQPRMKFRAIRPVLADGNRGDPGTTNADCTFRRVKRLLDEKGGEASPLGAGDAISFDHALSE